MKYLNTKEQEADMLIRGIGKTQHEYLLSKLGVFILFIPSNSRGSIREGVTYDGCSQYLNNRT